MSIDFGISNDKDQSNVDTFECYHCDGKGCQFCTNGQIVVKSSAFAMNVANANASLILSSLGIDCEECSGSINANALLKAIASTDAARMVRGTLKEGNMWSCGITVTQAQRYLDRLKNIADEAARREEPVCWG